MKERFKNNNLFLEFEFKILLGILKYAKQCVKYSQIIDIGVKIYRVFQK